MSGSHGQPEPLRDARYSLEDTIYELPPVIRGEAHREHVLSGLFRPYKRGDACAIQAEPQGGMVFAELHVDQLQIDATIDGHDTRTYDKRVDERLAVLEEAASSAASQLTAFADATTQVLSTTFETVDELAVRVVSLEQRVKRLESGK